MITKGKIKLDWLFITVNIFVVDQADEIPNEIRNDSFCQGYCAQNNSTGEIRIYIWSECGGSVITHEAVHCKNRIYRKIGQYQDLHNDEMEAYLTGYIAKKLTELLYKHKAKKEGSN